MRILALDGGGIKGAFTASVLAALETELERPVVDHFDLITGTSTGGILAIGLGMGFSASELRDFYIDRGGEIFGVTSVFGRLGFLKQLFAPKHSSAPLEAALIDILGERKFGESLSRLAIPTYDAVAGRIFLMKTAHNPRFVHDVGALALDVAMATAAAPTYFEAKAFPAHQGASYVDGGVWANCPALVGLTEAVAFLGAKAEKVDILSIGTTSSPFNIADERRSGALQWNMGLINLMFEAQVETARAQASLLAGGFHRIDASVASGRFGLDKADAMTISELVTLGRGEAVKKENLDVVRSRFLNGTPASPFMPYV
ncbi:MAG: CBASS cGAMP-activated phospholipase [Erythrobacter sp.]|uniref:CBASS cGAMP-activated phospholipase n=1 Tax=Parasphingorhabdus sp. TaxID=2709688 RepID=UPI00326BCD90